MKRTWIRNVVRVALLSAACGVAADAGAGGAPEVIAHAGVTVDLVPNAERGTVTYPLRVGTIASTGATVYFIITDVSDRNLAELTEAVGARALDESLPAGVEDATFDEGAVIDGVGTWTFFNDPGTVSYLDGAGGVVRPLANPDYSPLKRIIWDGQEVIVNAPFIKWGDGPGQTLVIDTGGCDPRIRSNPPSPFFVGDGPTDGVDCSTEGPLDRYKGGQVVDLDLGAMTVTFKLQMGFFRESVRPYYIVTDASKLPAAEFMGVIHSPKTANLGREGETGAVEHIFQFANGVKVPTGGPNRFQSGIPDYHTFTANDYTPMWHILWLFFDCDGDGVFFAENRNIAFGATPVPGSGIPGFDPADPATFDPFGMDDKGVECPDFAREVSGDPDGFVFYKDENQLIKKGFMIATEAPSGLPEDSSLQPPLIVNCPVPVLVR